MRPMMINKCFIIKYKKQKPLFFTITYTPIYCYTPITKIILIAPKQLWQPRKKKSLGVIDA